MSNWTIDQIRQQARIALDPVVLRLKTTTDSTFTAVKASVVVVQGAVDAVEADVSGIVADVAAVVADLSTHEALDINNGHSGTLNDTKHGNRGGGSLHPLATNSVAGFVPAANGSAGDVLTISGGAWVPAAPTGGAGGFTNPMTTAGDLIYGGVAGVATRLSIGTEGYVLTVSGGLPVWQYNSASGSSSSSGTGAYSEVIGDGVTTIFTVTHALGTRNVLVAVRETASGYAFILPDIAAITTNAVTLVFSVAPSSGQYTAIVSKGTDGGDGSGSSYTAPPTTGWSWANQGTASVSLGTNTLSLIDTAAADGNPRNHLYYRTAPGTPWSIEIGIKTTLVGTDYSNAGVGWRQSSDGKFIIIRRIFNSASWRITVTSASDPTTEVSNILSFNPAMMFHDMEWYKLVDTGTNREAWISADRINWVKVYSEGRTSYLTGDQVCLSIDSRNNTYGAALSLHHWEVA